MALLAGALVKVKTPVDEVKAYVVAKTCDPLMKTLMFASSVGKGLKVKVKVVADPSPVKL